METWVIELVRLVGEKIDEFLCGPAELRSNPTEANPLRVLLSIANESGLRIELDFGQGCSLVFKPGRCVAFHRSESAPVLEFKPGYLAAIDAMPLGILRDWAEGKVSLARILVDHPSIL